MLVGERLLEAEVVPVHRFEPVRTIDFASAKSQKYLEGVDYDQLYEGSGALVARWGKVSFLLTVLGERFAVRVYCAIRTM